MLFGMCSLQLYLYPGFLFLMGGEEEGEFKIQIYTEDLKWSIEWFCPDNVYKAGEERGKYIHSGVCKGEISASHGKAQL